MIELLDRPLGDSAILLPRSPVVWKNKRSTMLVLKSWTAGRVLIGPTTVDDPNLVAMLWYHDTLVCTYDRETGIVTLETAGYRTATTKIRMNQFADHLGLPYRVYQHDWQWYVQEIGPGYQWGRVYPFGQAEEIDILLWLGRPKDGRTFTRVQRVVKYDSCDDPGCTAVHRWTQEIDPVSSPWR